MFHKTGGNMTGAASVKQDVKMSGRKEDITLNDYIERKEQAYKKKLSFEEWWNEVVYTGNPRKVEFGTVGTEPARLIWKAAQENV